MSRELTLKERQLIDAELHKIEWIQGFDIVDGYLLLCVEDDQHKDVLKETDEGIQTLPGSVPAVLKELIRISQEVGVPIDEMRICISSTVDAFLTLREDVRNGKGV